MRYLLLVFATWLVGCVPPTVIGITGIGDTLYVHLGDTLVIIGVALPDTTPPDTTPPDTTMPPAVVDTLLGVPLIDMGDSITYKGYEGGLYPGGNDEAPAAHLARQPQIDTSQPFGFASLGMSNTWWEWCKSPWDSGPIQPYGCTEYSFAGAVADSVGVHPSLRLVSGAQGGKVADDWRQGSNSAWTNLNSLLAEQDLEPADLKVVWIKVVNRNPDSLLPDPSADAYDLLEDLGDIVRLLKARYGVQQAYLSSRIWAPACAGPKNPEPYAYEGGYAVKWLIEAQIKQLEGAPESTIAGDLSLVAAPWLAWGPYLWADNGNERSDGLTWSPDDMYTGCNEHPGVAGIIKVANLLVAFFRDSPLTSWFRP